MARVTDDKEKRWYRKHHVKMLYSACAGFMLGLYLSYQGGIRANDALIMASFAILGLSCALLLVTKK